MSDLYPFDYAAELRDGSVTHDPRLDRLEHFDERSRDYPVRTLIPTDDRVRSYTWTVGAHLDQGQEGACVGFAWAHELVGKPVKVSLDDPTARARFIYHEAQRIDPWPGGMYPGASPRYEGTSVLAGAQTCKALGYVEEYRWAFDLKALVQALGYHGPAVLGVNWHEGMATPDADGYIHPTGPIRGGHAVCAYGVRVVPRVGVKYREMTWEGVDMAASSVAIWNSWGPDWGVNGACRITLRELAELLAVRGEACIPVLRAKG